MKLYFNLLFLVSICLFVLPAYSQIRHVRGIKSLEASYLVTRYGSGAGLGFVKYQSNSLYLKVGGFFEQGKDAGITYESIGGEVAMAKTLLRQGHVNYLNVIGGVAVSVDRVKAGAEQFDISSEFKGGALGGIEDELFITDKLVLVTSWSQRFLLNSAYGNYRWYATFGVRFNL